MGWPRVLAKLYNREIVDRPNVEGQFGNYAMGGSSHWYSYEQFLQNYKKHDVIVFSHTNCERWPATKPGIEGKAWNIGHAPDPDMDIINKFRKDIFPSNLLQFIGLNILKDVIQKCEEENIYLINIFPFPNDYELPKTKFPIIHNLDYISHHEETRYHNHYPKVNYGWTGRYRKFFDFRNKEFIPTVMINNAIHFDHRQCHFNCKNNRRFANILYDMISKKEYNTIVDCTKLDWDYRDEEMDLIYEKIISNR
jgi:hypothetical protein